MEYSTLLVTGAAGFIGSHLVERLLLLGFRVIGLDNFANNYSPAIKKANLLSSLKNQNFEFFEADILELSSLRSLFLSTRPDIVIHLAARPGVRDSFKEAGSYLNINVQGTSNVLAASQLAAIRHVVFASSSSVYGIGNGSPFCEDDLITRPGSVYAASKVSGELLCHAYHHAFGFDVTCLRLFTVYGPRQRPDLAFSVFAQRIMDDKPIVIYGDGSTVRDYTYIDDAINGITAAALSPSGLRVFNLGSGRPIFLRDAVASLENGLGWKAKIEFAKIQPGEMLYTHADISRATKELGFCPTTTLHQGIEHYVKWLKTAGVTSHCA